MKAMGKLSTNFFCIKGEPLCVTTEKYSKSMFFEPIFLGEILRCFFVFFPIQEKKYVS